MSGTPDAAAGAARPGPLPAALLAGGAALAVYGLTLVREPGWGDPAELALQAWRFGLSHPPGAPAHNLLAGLAVRLGAEPAFATALFSALCTAVAAACVAWSAHRLTGRRRAALVAGGVFAFAHPIWVMAVTTELYALSACCLALTLLLLLTRRPLAAGVAFAWALGAYRPNLLLALPAAWLAVRHAGGSRRPLVRFLAPALLGGIAWLGWDLARAAAAPPLGTEFPPDTLPHLARYLAATQYTAHPPADPGFYLDRVVEHGVRVARYLLGAGLLLAGAGVWRLRHHPAALPLALWGLVGFGYFTFHPYTDYYLMPHAGYLVLALAAGVGVAALDPGDRRRGPRRLAGVLAIALPVLMVAFQLGPFRARAATPEVTRFVRESFAVLPRGAVVFARWERFTALLYAQQVHGVRRDLLLLERQEKTRRYGPIVVAGWRSFARAALGRRPVVVDGPETRLVLPSTMMPGLREPPGAVELRPLAGPPVMAGVDSVRWSQVVRLR